ncbi:SMP-30/gluconolactonase/LRE family protein [Rheinheimera sp. 4Y26]|uniref:SMP-30/gluconolactonase/LRE family protein n=1 Tax=Rheinheimera sp. 4Y26 TaxID=2977811 RepID=UPI0021B1391A|nr:SMP-30/gluconolactonase/LRE family protein [Rheinheimera sp. 4Y26]MCT6700307.1 SMP-30/gluconolactonase/LRE family protein [Rheinheimera sp. 4Y26]
MQRFKIKNMGKSTLLLKIRCCKHAISALLLSLLPTAPLWADTPTPTQPSPDSEIFVAAGVFHPEIEGPAVDAEGNLYAVNFGGNSAAAKGSIGKITAKGEASHFLQLPKASVGNGIRFDQQGRMYIADYTGHNIWRYHGSSLSLYLHQPLMFQPNDLAISQQGVLFASDPDWKNNSGQIWRINKAGSSSLLEKNMGTTNGIEVSPNQRFLYVNESRQRKVWRYQLDKKLNISNKTLLIEFPDHGLDGMRCDNNGNLYIARYGKGTIAKISPQGKLLREYQLHGKFPTNVTFSSDFKFLYITMQKDGAVERLKLQ